MIKTKITPPEVRLKPISEATEREDREKLRLVPLGGLEEIGRNMSFLEYKDEIVIIDMGIQFPEEETPGIDFIIPNTDYLEKKRKNIKGLILTHGHFDHIGAIPYLIGKIGNPIIYATGMTKALVLKHQNDFPHAPKLNIINVENGSIVKIGNYFTAEFFGVDHTIPDTAGVILKTPVGNIVHFADFRIEYNALGEPQDLDKYQQIGKMGIHTLMIDSTNADEPGRSLSEKVVEKNLEDLFRKTEGRIIITLFSTLLTRIYEILKIADRIGRKVAITGRSMKENVELAQSLGYIKPAKDLIIPIEEVNKYKDNRVMVFTTGSQGQTNSGLMKILTGENRYVRIKPGDMVIFSSSSVPGNERSVQNIKDGLCRQGADVYTSELIDIHASGHAPAEDLKTVIKLIQPKFLLPVHGHYFKRAANAKIGADLGMSKDHLMLMDNGQIAVLDKNSFKISKEAVPANYVMVDGLGVGDVSEIVLRDRMLMSADGMFVIIAVVDSSTGKVKGDPDIISRGFIYMKESRELLGQTKKKIKETIAKTTIPGASINWVYVRNNLRDKIGQFLYTKTKRRPMILPVIVEV
ncbi:MAG: ribonuclease J [Parcubacteria group bacterium]|nr:ribonuclease J [Parcubacteria group bacterium]